MYVNNHIIKDLGTLKLIDVRPAHIEQFFGKRSKLSYSALRHIRVALKGIFETAIENNLCKDNPVKPKKQPAKEKAKVPKVFSISQVKSILKDAKTHKYRDYVLLPLYTGLREGELIALQWSDVDMKENLITVRQSRARKDGGGYENKETKNYKVRQVGITPELSAILTNMPRKGVYLFCDDIGRQISPSTFYHRYKAFFDETGNYYLSPHKCRHTYATYSLRGGVDLRLLQALLGHSRITTTEMYTEVDTGDIKGSITKLKY